MLRSQVTTVTALLLVVTLTACQSKTPPSAPSANGKSASLQAMESVASTAHKCWFASRDPAFRHYSFANELNSYTGQPRFLLVPINNFGGKPLLVVQARGDSSRIEYFGPLLGGPLGSRVSGDLNRWSNGDAACAASA